MSTGQTNQSLYSSTWSENLKLQPLYVAEGADAAIQPGYVNGSYVWVPFTGNYSYAKGFRQGNHVRFYAKCKWSGGASGGASDTFVISMEPLITAGWFSSSYDYELSSVKVNDNGGAALQWLSQADADKKVEKSFVGFQPFSAATSTDPIHGLKATYYDPVTGGTPVQGTYSCADVKGSTAADYLSIVVDIWDQLSYA